MLEGVVSCNTLLELDVQDGPRNVQSSWDVLYAKVMCHFCDICQRQCQVSSVQYFENKYRNLCKTEGSNPIKVDSPITNRCFDRTQI